MITRFKKDVEKAVKRHKDKRHDYAMKFLENIKRKNSWNNLSGHQSIYLDHLINSDQERYLDNESFRK
jgi:hypothetical protein